MSGADGGIHWGADGGRGVEVRRRCAAHVLIDDGADMDTATVPLSDDVEHHLRRVLRLRDGDSVSVTDGDGRWCVGRFRTVDATVVVDAERGMVVERPAPRFTLITAIPKGDRIDWLVQKTTELGADRIVLIDAENSVVRWTAERADKQLVRLQRIANEATRQSRRVWRTVVSGPCPALDVLPGAVLAEFDGLPIHGDETSIAIGPEGGWSGVELRSSGHRVRLGDNILRVETAAVTATALRMVGHHGTRAFRS